MKKFLTSFQKWFFRFSSIYIILIILCLVKVDYYLYLPGNLTDVSEEITVEGYDQELNGSVSSIYVVSLVRPTLFEYLVTKDLPYVQSYKMTKAEVSSYDKTVETAIGNFDSYESFSNAEIAVYSLLHEDESDYYKQITILYSATNEVESSTSYTSLVGKIIAGIGEEADTYPTMSEVQSYLSTIGIGEYASLELEDTSGNKTNVTIKKRDNGSSGVFGITIKTSFKLSIEPFVTVDDVYTQGPSGGAMQALYIYLKMTNEDLLKGRKIAGTGTIGTSYDSDGNLTSFAYVGAIGCVEQKLYAAYLDHASVFYCPASNYDDCMEAYETYGFDENDIRVVKVTYLSDILDDLRG